MLLLPPAPEPPHVIGFTIRRLSELWGIEGQWATAQVRVRRRIDYGPHDTAWLTGPAWAFYCTVGPPEAGARTAIDTPLPLMMRDIRSRSGTGATGPPQKAT